MDIISLCSSANDSLPAPTATSDSANSHTAAMATAAVLAPHDVPTTLNYYAPIGEEAPYQYVQEPPEGRPSNNIGTDPQPVLVHDARGHEADFSLDQNGFQYVKWPSVESAFDDDERIKEKYYPEVEEILRTVAGAKRVFIFDHTIRYVPVPASCSSSVS